MNSRKGLKRYLWSLWIVEGPLGAYEIEKDRARRWLVRPHNFPRCGRFFVQEFPRLRDARACAEQRAGIA